MFNYLFGLLIVIFSSTALADNSKAESNGTIVYQYTSHAAHNKLNSSQVSLKQNYKTSYPITFDILLDEKIDENDPRLKTIIYVTQQREGNSLLISYTNPNASDLAARIVLIMNKYGITSNSPRLIPSTGSADLKVVTVQIKYITSKKVIASAPVVVQNK